MENEFGRVRLLKDWNFWDNSVHCEQPQIERQARCLYYPFTFEINKENGTGIFSSTTDIPFYNTTLSNCDCYDFQERKQPCKHIYRLAVELGVIEIFKRPTFDKEILENIKNSSDIDNEPDQLKRQKSALSSKCRPVSIDKEHCVAVFKSSGKGFYEATLEKCTCRDYFVRRLPCKHIYRLRMELSNSSPTDLSSEENATFEKEEAKEMLRQLTKEEATLYIYNLSFDRWFSLKDTDKYPNLVSSQLIVCSDDIGVYLSFLKKDELTTICTDYSVLFKKSSSKNNLIDVIISSLPADTLNRIKSNLPLPVKRNNKAQEVFGAVKRLYHKLYPAEPLVYDFSN